MRINTGEHFVRVANFFKEKFAKWLARGYSETFGMGMEYFNWKTFYPLHDHIGVLMNDTTGDVLNIFNTLPVESQSRFIEGLILALGKVKGDSLYHMLFLVRRLRPPEAIPVLYEHIRGEHPPGAIGAVCPQYRRVPVSGAACRFRAQGDSPRRET